MREIRRDDKQPDRQGQRAEKCHAGSGSTQARRRPAFGLGVCFERGRCAPRGVAFASNEGMLRRASVVLTLLLASGSARAQPQPTGLPATPAEGAVIPAGGASRLLLLELYAFALAQTVTQSAAARVSPEAAERQVANYFTNGAEATTVPSSGPGAAYFQNGAEVLAAPTSVVPFAFAPPEAETGATTPVDSQPNAGR